MSQQPFAAIDSSNNLPAVVRERLAQNLADPATVEGEALGRSVAELGATVSKLEQQPFVVMMHAGNNLLAPESTMEWYESAFAYNFGCMDGGDLRSMIGCTTDLAICHNTTVDFHTTATGPVAEHSPMSYQALDVDSAAWFRQGVKDTKAVTYRQVLTRFAGKTVLIPELKDAATSVQDPRPVLLDMIREFRVEKSTIVASYNRDDLVAFVEAGIEVCWIASAPNVDVSAATLLSEGIRWVQLQGVSWTNASLTGTPPDAVSDAKVSEFVAGGLNVLIWTLGRQSEVDRYKALGVKGVVTTSPYASGDPSKYRRRTDPLASNRQYAAPFLTNSQTNARDDTFSDDHRGVFANGRHRSVVGGGANNQTILQAWACPLETPASVQIELNLVIDVPHANMGQGFSLDVCALSDAPFFADTTSRGYRMYFRQNGSCNLYKYTSGSTGSIATATWTPLLPSPPALSSALTAGASVTALPVNALPASIPAGTRLLVPTAAGVGGKGQIVTTSSTVSAGATSIPIASVTLTSGVASGSQLPQVLPLRATITPTTVSLNRMDYGSEAALTATDSAYRGPYWFVSKYGGGSGSFEVSYRDAVITPL